MRRLLIVEDEVLAIAALDFFLRTRGFDVDRAQNGRLALDMIARHTPDAIITDLRMPVMNGAQLVREVRKTLPNLPIIVLTGIMQNEDAVLELSELPGPVGIFQKPLDPNRLVEALARFQAEKKT